MTWNGWTNDNEPAIGMRVEVTPLVRSLAEDGAPGYGPLPGDAPGTVFSVYAGLTRLSAVAVVQRVWVKWDEPGETTAEQSWRVADLQPASPPPERADQ